MAKFKVGEVVQVHSLPADCPVVEYNLMEGTITEVHDMTEQHQKILYTVMMSDNNALYVVEPFLRKKDRGDTDEVVRWADCPWMPKVDVPC